MREESADVAVGSYPPVMFTSMSPKPRFARCAFNAASASAAFMSGTSRMSIFATARCGRIVFPPGPVYPPHQPLDVHRRLRLEPLVRLLPRQVIDPVLHAELLLRLRLAAAFRPLGDHRPFLRAD